MSIQKSYSTREGLRVRFVCSGPSRTDQSQKDACDIDGIVERFTRTGVLPQGRQNGQFADVSGLSGTPADRVAFAQPILNKVDAALADRAAHDAAVAAAVKADREQEKRKQRMRREVARELDSEETKRS